jgi:hypothetical protein
MPVGMNVMKTLKAMQKKAQRIKTDQHKQKTKEETKRKEQEWQQYITKLETTTSPESSETKRKTSPGSSKTKRKISPGSSEKKQKISPESPRKKTQTKKQRISPTFSSNPPFTTLEINMYESTHPYSTTELESMDRRMIQWLQYQQQHLATTNREKQRLALFLRMNAAQRRNYQQRVHAFAQMVKIANDKKNTIDPSQTRELQQLHNHYHKTFIALRDHVPPFQHEVEDDIFYVDDGTYHLYNIMTAK